MTTGGKPVGSRGDVSPLPPTTLLERLDGHHVTLAIALGRRHEPTIYSEAAAEIRRLMELLKK